MLWNGKGCGKHRGDENVKETVFNADYVRSKTTGECVIFKINL
jgi:hypothetical protein